MWGRVGVVLKGWVISIFYLFKWKNGGEGGQVYTSGGGSSIYQRGGSSI